MMRMIKDAVGDKYVALDSSAASCRLDEKQGSVISYYPRYYFVFPERRGNAKSLKALVKGFFVNLNRDCVVYDFTDFSMDFYGNEQLLVSGYFGTINSFAMNPQSVNYQTFTFTGYGGLGYGSYTCDSDDYCLISFNFSYFAA